tara:strand:- start:1585 stop:2223 length:639 start_codon:yes stop_codon:yes gene_type:complete
MPSNNKIEIPLIEATNQNLKGYGYLVNDFDQCEIEIVTWPKQGWRNIEEGTGNEGGTTEGPFETWWEEGILYGRNTAVEHKGEYDKDGRYLLGYSSDPDDFSYHLTNEDPSQIYIWHVNYHPDGGQLFFPEGNKPFISPLALPGDDIQPDNFKAFYFDGSQGLYIHPNIWHEGVFPTKGRATFKGKQGKVHARVSIDLLKEFRSYLYFNVST